MQTSIFNDDMTQWSVDKKVTFIVDDCVELNMPADEMSAIRLEYIHCL